MPDPFRLPRLKTLDRIVDDLGRPSVAFVKFLNTDFAGTLERQEALQSSLIEALADAVAAIEAAQAAAAAAQTAATEAQAAAAAAQTAADGAATAIETIEETLTGLDARLAVLEEA